LQLASAKTKPAPSTPVAIDRFFTLVPSPNTSPGHIGSRTVEDDPPISNDGNDVSRLSILRYPANRLRAVEFRRLAGVCANVTSSKLDCDGSSRLRASRKS
jgi:hypothetical protein